jgi:hypothetical protein
MLTSFLLYGIFIKIEVFNATTYYLDHVAGRSADTRLASAWYGSNRELKVKALEIAMEMAS